ncbi:MAG TPA: adenosylmethionine decarboxylase [Candidatus Paceibacterota bacterium]|nr:adenosylmethionine decarboxylase [Candidatus Paceibacterota bacterium]
MQYGKHLLVEVKTKNPKGLTNQNFIKGVLKKIILAVKLKAVLPLIVYKFPQKDKNTASGLTAFSIVAESHLSIHTWPENNYFAFDLFSCKDFKEKEVLKIIRESFLIEKIHYQVINRGLKVDF